jgi:hypothetical protein
MKRNWWKLAENLAAERSAALNGNAAILGAISMVTGFVGTLLGLV